jgi:hypothetical protein
MDKIFIYYMFDMLIEDIDYARMKIKTGIKK